MGTLVSRKINPGGWDALTPDWVPPKTSHGKPQWAKAPVSYRDVVISSSGAIVTKTEKLISECYRFLRAKDDPQGASHQKC